MSARREAYPGSASFQDTPEDCALFFGRSEEKTTLLHLVLAENLVLLFSRSGMGKTSLINAGLKKPLRDRGFFPITTRVAFDPEGGPVKSVLTGICEEAGRQNVKMETRREGSYTLWHFFDKNRFYCGSRELRPVLVLDQFEELFTRVGSEGGQARVEEFTRQLADLIHRRVPEDKRQELIGRVEALPEDSPERRQLLDQLYRGLDTDVKVVISIREDFLPELEFLKTFLPDIFRASFRLEGLDLKKAREAIEEPGKQSSVLGDNVFDFEPGVVDEMLAFLSQQRSRGQWRRGNHVEPHLLQIICQHLNQRVLRRNKAGDRKTVTKSDLGGKRGLNRIIRRRYSAIVRRFGILRPGWSGRRYKPSLANWIILHWPRPPIRKLCEKGLIIGGGFRNSLARETVVRNYGLKDADLDRLVDEKLLRKEDRLGQSFYELSHDTWISTCRIARRWRRLRHVLAMVLLVLSPVLVRLGGEWYDDYQRLAATNKMQETVARILKQDKPSEQISVELVQLVNSGRDWPRDLSNITLTNADFRDGKLQGIDFSRANLAGGNFSRGILHASDFTQAHVDGANFTDVKGLHVSFQGAKGRSAQFTNATLDGAEFDGAELAGSCFTSCSLQDASFFKSSLPRSSFSSSDAQRASFKGANLSGARFYDVELEEASFDDATLDNTRFEGSNWWLAYGWSDAQLAELRGRSPVAAFSRSQRFRNIRCVIIGSILRAYALAANVNESEIDENQLVGLLSTRKEDRLGSNYERSRNLNRLAWFLAVNSTNLAPALQLSERSLLISPDDSDYLDTKGYILLRQGNTVQALTHLQSAVKSSIGNGGHEYHLALAMEALGQKEASDWFIRAARHGYRASYELVLTPRRPLRPEGTPAPAASPVVKKPEPLFQYEKKAFRK